VYVCLCLCMYVSSFPFFSEEEGGRVGGGQIVMIIPLGWIIARDIWSKENIHAKFFFRSLFFPTYEWLSDVEDLVSSPPDVIITYTHIRTIRHFLNIIL
jgi:hypothetical protein